MYRTVVKSVVAFSMFIIMASVAEAGTFTAAAREKAVAGEYIVVLHEHAARLVLEAGSAAAKPAVPAVAQRLSRRYGIRVLKTWDRVLRGMLISASEETARRLAADPRVALVEQRFMGTYEASSSAGSCYGLDSYPYGTLFYRTPPAASPQTLNCTDPDPTHDSGGSGQPPLCQDNWGLDLVDQHSLSRDGLYTYDRTGSIPGQVNVTIWVLDLGINAAHREFLNSAGTASRVSTIDFSNDGTSCPANTDPIGHGTHTAAIAAGRIFGVAKDAYVTLLKVVKCTGGYSQDWFVEALNTAAGVRPSVVNWSGGNDQGILQSGAIRIAVQGTINAGVMIVQAAGNQSSPYPQPGYSPAVYPTGVEDACNWSFGGIAGVLVAGGIDQNGARWTRQISGDLVQSVCPPDCGSNVGSCISLWAPASNIVSAGQHDIYGYCRLSGTSMAAPMVAGAAALYLQAHPSATPAQVKAALIAAATPGLLNTNTT